VVSSPLDTPGNFEKRRPRARAYASSRSSHPCQSNCINIILESCRRRWCDG